MGVFPPPGPGGGAATPRIRAPTVHRGLTVPPLARSRPPRPPGAEVPSTKVPAWAPASAQPDLAHLPSTFWRRVWDHVMWRLGDEPRRAGAPPGGSVASDRPRARWLVRSPPKFAALPIPPRWGSAGPARVFFFPVHGASVRGLEGTSAAEKPPGIPSELPSPLGRPGCAAVDGPGRHPREPLPRGAARRRGATRCAGPDRGARGEIDPEPRLAPGRSGGRASLGPAATLDPRCLGTAQHRRAATARCRDQLPFVASPKRRSRHDWPWRGNAAGRSE